MTKTRIIGDLHGKMAEYHAIIADVDHSIQVGDFGIGFGSEIKPPENINHRFERGNHDSPRLCETYKNYIPDGHYENISNSDDYWMAVGGAHSIDYAYRQENVSWWRDEEINEVRFGEIFDDYCHIKPKIMFTHDAPNSAVTRLFEGRKLYMHKYIEATHTSRWFDIFLEVHKPNLWIFGHWHMAADQVIEGTRFICLPECGWIDINL